MAHLHTTAVYAYYYSFGYQFTGAFLAVQRCV